jgi:hypothetical protein
MTWLKLAAERLQCTDFETFERKPMNALAFKHKFRKRKQAGAELQLDLEVHNGLPLINEDDNEPAAVQYNGLGLLFNTAVAIGRFLYNGL